jgi:ATP-dependent exoDNAse (exonuclease V) alpha subunit
MTVHKAQGLTLPRAVMHLNRAWACSQVYVALARLSSLDGLYLSSALDRRFFEGLQPADKRALSFYQGLK